jgi:hypothetical protein
LAAALEPVLCRKIPLTAGGLCFSLPPMMELMCLVLRDGLDEFTCSTGNGFEVGEGRHANGQRGGAMSASREVVR